jgi:signal transduction histidine kinase
VVANLLSNALKFTPSGGNIRLGAKQRGSAVVVEVRDTGRGMSREEQKGLFEPYHRLDRDPSGGLGLGLALCKMLVELHGGEMWVRSNVGRGSTFGFSLPLEAADEHAVESVEER